VGAPGRGSASLLSIPDHKGWHPLPPKAVRRVRRSLQRRRNRFGLLAQTAPPARSPGAERVNRMQSATSTTVRPQLRHRLLVVPSGNLRKSAPWTPGRSGRMATKRATIAFPTVSRTGGTASFGIDRELTHVEPRASALIGSLFVHHDSSALARSTSEQESSRAALLLQVPQAVMRPSSTPEPWPLNRNQDAGASDSSKYRRPYMPLAITATYNAASHDKRRPRCAWAPIERRFPGRPRSRISCLRPPNSPTFDRH